MATYKFRHDLQKIKSFIEFAKGSDVIGTLGILRLAYKTDLIDKSELGKLVATLHEILYFTDKIEKWVLSGEKL